MLLWLQRKCIFSSDADLLPRIERLKSGQLQTLSRSTLLLRLIRRGLCYAEKTAGSASSKSRGGSNTSYIDDIFRRATLHQIHCFLLDGTESCRKTPSSCCEELAQAKEELDAALFAPIPDNRLRETLNSQINAYSSAIRSVYSSSE